MILMNMADKKSCCDSTWSASVEYGKVINNSIGITAHGRNNNKCDGIINRVLMSQWIVVSYPLSIKA